MSLRPGDIVRIPDEFHQNNRYEIIWVKGDIAKVQIIQHHAYYVMMQTVDLEPVPESKVQIMQKHDRRNREF